MFLTIYRNTILDFASCSRILANIPLIEPVFNPLIRTRIPIILISNY